MTEDELKSECMRFFMDTSIMFNAEKFKALMDLCKRHQAVGLREAADKIDMVYELNRIELFDWCILQANERDGFANKEEG